MDKVKQKPKKDKPMKNVDKEKSPSLIADVKTIKENLKIREILRTVKMNSSMRIKAPRGSKVMQNRDFNDTEDIFEDVTIVEGQDDTEPPSATNPDVVINQELSTTEDSVEETYVNNDEESNTETIIEPKISIIIDGETCTLQKSVSLSEDLADSTQTKSDENDNSDDNSTSTLMVPDVSIPQSPSESPHLKIRDRKLSLDHTMLSRREGLSQSELDLHSIGKSPLERKSSFFRKKMDSFLKNTTEIFKRQSLGCKPQPIQRRGSMSVSLQSLNEKTVYDSECSGQALDSHEEFQSSVTSLRSSCTPARSNSSVSVSQSDRLPDQSGENSLAGSQPALAGSQPFANFSSNSIHSLNEGYLQESLLSSRAISMSSGLDSAHAKGRRKASRSNRVTWVASESLTDYFRRLIQDEKSKEMQVCHSYQDFSTIPENNLYGPKVDSKGRRLSYQRAVSGEDPVLNMRYQDSSLRRKSPIPENSEVSYALITRLAEYSLTGVPPLKSFEAANIPDTAYAYVLWAGKQNNLDEFANWKVLSANEEAKQAVIRELIFTEADHIHHLTSVVEIFLGTLHALQDNGLLLGVDTKRLFINIPDLLNANLLFWNATFYPMLVDAVTNNTLFDVNLLIAGFNHFAELFAPYEYYLIQQSDASEYLRFLSKNVDFKTYLDWCHSKVKRTRLMLSDLLVKPMQRLTKYNLLIRRLQSYAHDEDVLAALADVDVNLKYFLIEVNRSVRFKEDMDRLETIQCTVEGYDPEFKDEDMDKHFHERSQLRLDEAMLNCMPYDSRALIYEGDLRFKDNKESRIDVRAILFTDMLLICKKFEKPRGGKYLYKMIRPKFMISKALCYPKSSIRNNVTEVTSLIYIILDDFGTSCAGFMLSDIKDSHLPSTLRTWELKIREAQVTYEFSMYYAKNPTCVIEELKMNPTSIFNTTKALRQTSDDDVIEESARERLATMIHRRGPAALLAEFSCIPMLSDSLDGGETSSASGSHPPRVRPPMQRNSTDGSSRDSRISSYQLSSSSAASHDEPQPGPSNYVPEHLQPPRPVEVAAHVLLNAVSESDSENEFSMPSTSITQTPMVILEPAPSNDCEERSMSPGTASQNTLLVQPLNTVNFGHSLPDLSARRSLLRPSPCPSPVSASEKMYQSHQELLERNRLLAAQQQQYLSPDHRGTSNPPPIHTRASLKRGLAFSYSFKYPPLYKMGHVNSQFEAGPSSNPDIQVLERPLTPVPSVSSERGDKKSKQASGRLFGKKNKDDGETASAQKPKDQET